MAQQQQQQRYLVCYDEVGNVLNETNAGIISLLHQHDGLSCGHWPPKPVERTPGIPATAKIGQVAIEYVRSAPGLAGNYELFFSLWSGGGCAQTEEFSVALPFGAGHNAYSRGVFKNVELGDAATAVSLVCRIVKLVSELDEKKQRSSQVLSIRRPFAVGAVPLAQVSPATGLASLQFVSAASDALFAEAPALLTRKGANAAVAAAAEPGLTPLAPGEVGVEVRMTVLEGLWDELLPTNAALGTAVVCNVVHPGEVSLPDATRSDLYVTLECGRFTQGKHIEVVMLARQDNGTPVNNCISVGTLDREYQYHSTVWMDTASPTWRETVRLRIPLHVFHRTHLYFSVKHCHRSKDKTPVPFAFAWLKLSDENKTLIRDGVVNLELYKASGVAPPQPSFYLASGLSCVVGSASSPSPTGATPSTPRRDSSLVLRKGETLTLRVQSFCRVPHDEKISGVLYWNEHQEMAGQLLEKLTYAETDEMVQFVPELLTAIFQIFENTSKWEIDPLALKCYQSLVMMLGYIVDERNKKYALHRTVLERHIDESFSNKMAHKHLLRCVMSFLETDNMTPTIKALPLLFRFITTSRIVENQGVIADMKHDTEFKQQLSTFFYLYSSKMASTNASSVAARAIAVKNFDAVLVLLERFYVRRELCEIFVTFVSKLPFDDKHDLFNRARLQLIGRLLDGVLHLDVDTLPFLVPLIVTVFQQQPRIAIGVASQLLDYIYAQRDNPAVHEVFPQVMSMFPKLAGLVVQEYSSKQNEKSSSTTTTPTTTTGAGKQQQPGYTPPPGLKLTEHQLVVTTFLTLLSVMHYLEKFDSYLEEVQRTVGDADKGSRKFFLDIFNALGLVCLDVKLYPASWYTMQMFSDQTILQVLYYAKDVLFPRAPLASQQTPSANAELEVWSAFFKLGLGLLDKHQDIAWEAFPSPSPFQESWVNAPAFVVPVVHEGWMSLVRKGYFTSLIGPILHLLSLAKKLPEIQEFVCDLYYGIALDEYKRTGHFERATSNTCEIIDTMMRKKVCTAETLRTFLTVLVHGRFQAEDEATKAEATKFLGGLSDLLQLAVEFVDMPEGPEFEEERTIATMKMMNYFRSYEMNTYFRYAHALYHEHMRAEKKSYVEAGMTLLLHATHVPWTEDPLPAFEGGSPSLVLPAEQSWQRRERLYNQAIECFRLGGLYEKATEHLKELIRFHTGRRSYARLAECIELEAEMLEKTVEQGRVFAPFFLVSYVGRAFPIAIANKDFIYRGDDGETTEMLSDRLKKKFIRADVLDGSRANAVTDAMRAADHQYIAIAPVDPSCEEEARGEERTMPDQMPRAIRENIIRNNVSVFRRRIFAQANADGAQTCKHKTFYFTEATFPNIRRRLDIVRRTETDLSPIESAIDDTHLATEHLDTEFRALVENKTTAKLAAFSSLLTTIVGTAAARITEHAQAFFRSKQQQQPNAAQLASLRKALAQQGALLDKVLAFHDTECLADFRSMHQVVAGHVATFKSTLSSL